MLEDLFSDDEKATENQVDIITHLYLMISIWNDYLAKKVGEMISNLTWDANYYNDVQVEAMSQLITAGEAFGSQIEPVMKTFGKVILPILKETGEMEKDDLYTLAFAVSDVKSYMLEMDRASKVIGINPPLPSGITISQVVEIALTTL